MIHIWEKQHEVSYTLYRMCSSGHHQKMVRLESEIRAGLQPCGSFGTNCGFPENHYIRYWTILLFLYSIVLVLKAGKLYTILRKQGTLPSMTINLLFHPKIPMSISPKCRTSSVQHRRLVHP